MEVVKVSIPPLSEQENGELAPASLQHFKKKDMKTKRNRDLAILLVPFLGWWKSDHLKGCWWPPSTKSKGHGLNRWHFGWEWSCKRKKNDHPRTTPSLMCFFLGRQKCPTCKKRNEGSSWKLQNPIHFWPKKNPLPKALPSMFVGFHANFELLQILNYFWVWKWVEFPVLLEDVPICRFLRAEQDFSATRAACSSSSSSSRRGLVIWKHGPRSRKNLWPFQEKKIREKFFAVIYTLSNSN